MELEIKHHYSVYQNHRYSDSQKSKLLSTREILAWGKRTTWLLGPSNKTMPCVTFGHVTNCLRNPGERRRSSSSPNSKPKPDRIDEQPKLHKLSLLPKFSNLKRGGAASQSFLVFIPLLLHYPSDCSIVSVIKINGYFISNPQTQPNLEPLL